MLRGPRGETPRPDVIGAAIDARDEILQIRNDQLEELR